MDYTPLQLQQLCRTILFTCQDTLLGLGEKGKEEVQDKFVYDISTKGDRSIASKVHKLLLDAQVPADFCDEELGIIKLVNDPKYTIVFDDIDGTNNYNRGKGTIPFASCVAIFDKPLSDCTFNDVAAAAVLVHNNGLVVEAMRGKGCSLGERVAKHYVGGPHETVQTNYNFQETGPARTSGKKNIFKKDTVVAIEGYESGRQITRFSEIFEHAWVKDVSSSAHELMGVACGIYDAFIHPRHKKDEIAAGYLLVKEAGGSMMDFDGKSFDDKKFVYDAKVRYDVVAAATHPLATLLRVMIKPPQ